MREREREREQGNGIAASPSDAPSKLLRAVDKLGCESGAIRAVHL